MFPSEKVFFREHILNQLLFLFFRQCSLWKNHHEQRKIRQRLLLQESQEHNKIHEQPIVSSHGENST